MQKRLEKNQNCITVNEQNLKRNIMAKFIYINKVKPDVRWHNQFCVHKYHEFIIIFSGIMHVAGDSQKFALHPGEAALYPAGVHHFEHSDADEPVESCYIVFEDDKFYGNKILYKHSSDKLLRELASCLYDRFSAGRAIPFADDFLELMLKIFHAETMPQNKRFVNEADEFMYKHLASSISLDDIANAVGKSKFLFIRQYQQQTGLTPIQALWQMRCKEAVALLKYTTLSIKEIAFRTGFSDAGHFSRRIKAYCAKTPKKIRETSN